MHSITTALGLAAALALTACARHNGVAIAPPAVAVSVAAAHAVRTTRRLEVTGTLAARDSAVVASQQSGRIVFLAMREGDEVAAGQTLAVIDRSTYAAQASSAAGAGAAARAAVEAANFDVQAAQAAIAGARAKAVNTRLRAERFNALYAEGAVSRQERDDAVAAADAAKAELASAGAADASARARIAMASGEAAAADGRRVLADATLGQTSVAAPFDGIVTKRWRDVGAYANAGSPIVTVESSRRLELDLTIPEDAAGSLAAGAVVPVRIDAWSVGPLTARMRSLVPDDSGGTHAYVAKLDIGYHRGLLPGMFARAEVAGRPLQGIGIPASALIRRADQTGTFIIAAGKARFQPVTLLGTDGDTAVVGGLTDGASVVLAPGELTDGERVAAQ
ncbi:efflux RND transporter periplasmic adaptor subunit [bacterium]|nr:MAG: efflux RND transporter periplasmic adaptor subunit [bacterium]